MMVLALAFSVLFAPKTMRLDYFHTGDHGREIIAADRIVSDGPWAGSTTRLLDDLNLGTYFFEVVDPGTNRALYSRGQVRHPHVPRVAALPLAEGCRAGRSEEARARWPVP